MFHPEYGRYNDIIHAVRSSILISSNVRAIFTLLGGNDATEASRDAALRAGVTDGCNVLLKQQGNT